MPIGPEEWIAPDADFSAHNEEVKAVWAAYDAGSPIRAPITLGAAPDLYLLDERLDPGGITFHDYCCDADVAAGFQLWMSDCYDSLIAPPSATLSASP